MSTDVLNLVQAERPITIQVAGIDDNVLVVRGVHGTEYVSRLFKFDIELMAARSRSIQLHTLLGKDTKIGLIANAGLQRWFTGIITKVRRTGQDHDFQFFRAELRPAVWRLTKTHNCRIFQDRLVPDILMEVFSGFNVTMRLDEVGMNPRNYVVQYRESDWNFASRIMEEEGIFYYFTHDDGNHNLMLGNRNGDFGELQSPTNLRYDDDHAGRSDSRIYSWEKSQEFPSGVYTLRDYWFESPTRSLEWSETIRHSAPVGASRNEMEFDIEGNIMMEVLDYPGGYAKRYDECDITGQPRANQVSLLMADRDRTTRLRMQAEESHSLMLAGMSSYLNMTAGYRFNLQGHATDDDAYVLTSVEHSFSQSGTFRSSHGSAFKYDNRFTCVPMSMRFFPYDPAVQRPVIGMQTAVVVGAEGREIYTDKFGRVKVQFHWDRFHAREPRSSCWLRVAQPWAGRGWGHNWIPRVGHEVIVDFLEGDPDQPIVVGSVYNGDNKFPYITADDPAEASKQATKSGIRTRSTPNGRPSNYNEIFFEDAKGKEILGLHAERMMQTVVEASETHTVGANQTIKIGNDRSITVGGEKDGVKFGDVKEKIFHNKNLHVMVDSREKVEGKSDTHIMGEAVEKYDASCKLNITNDLHLKAGKNITLEAGTSITLVCRGAMIQMNASGITILGNPMVRLNPAGAVAAVPAAIPAPTAPDDPA